MKEPVTFKTEDSLWQTMAEGKKCWDARFFDISDDRIYRLCWGSWESNPPRGRRLRQPAYIPEEVKVCFLNKATGEVLQFRFNGIEFTDWAPGWCFIQLGGIIARYDADHKLVSGTYSEKALEWKVRSEYNRLFDRKKERQVDPLDLAEEG